MARDVLFEIGLEELPARFIDDAERYLRTKTEEWLKELRISYQSIVSYSTPRRLAVFIREVSDEQATVEEEVKGPAEKIAKDESGNWTKAAIGFTKGQGKSTEDIYMKELNGTSYIYVNKRIEGKRTSELLPAFQTIIESIPFGKNMRWGEETLRYARPIRWIVALYGSEVIPFEVANVSTSNTTYGHRFLGGKIVLEEPYNYESLLKEQWVIVDSMKREQLIVEGIKQLELEHNYKIYMDKDLLQEVRNLVEYPTVFVGNFEKSFLELPSEVLITSMKEHQRYFPVHSQDGQLLPYFIGVRNGDQNRLDTVIRGNEKVLRARLSDAQFFYEEDQKNSITFYLDKLENVVFQEKLGTIADKVRRMVAITEKTAAFLNLDESTISLAKRATSISKFDLMTNMVNEFTELQGVMGENYARKFGEEETVAKAIKEHYLPKGTSGEMPSTIEGSIVSVSDKLDTIVGCLSVGLRPTGSQDPYGLRRQAVGILRILLENDWNISVESLVHLAIEIHSEHNLSSLTVSELETEVLDFLRQRGVFLMKELYSIENDIIEATLSKEIGVFPYAVSKAKLLSNKRNDPKFKNVQEALVRVLNLDKKAEASEINPDLFQTNSEKELYNTFETVRETYEKLNSDQQADKALQEISKLTEPIHTFFEHNMVMDKDDKIRINRLAIIHEIASLIYSYADLSVIEWKQHF